MTITLSRQLPSNLATNKSAGQSVTGRARRRGTPFSRADRTALGRWFWEIDRFLLLLVSILFAIGLIAIASASPVAAQKLSTSTVHIDPLYYLYRQIIWVISGVLIILSISMLPKIQARRLAICGTIICLFLLLLVPIAGVTINGAQRWIGLEELRMQPSEFLKPFYVVSLAWVLSLGLRDESLPVMNFSLMFTLVIAVLLMQQPDLGQTLIFAGTWLVMVLIAGVSLWIITLLLSGGMMALIGAYFFYPIANRRINTWLFDVGDNYQAERAHATLTGGGFFGTGPGAGVAKFHLPEAHTDYIFSVIGEEMGLFFCIAIACIYLAIIVHVLIRLLNEEDNFLVLAVCGLTAQFGGQAIINMAVNTQLFPAKGITLPFVSYGGSSMLALSVAMGLLLSLTRRNPYAVRTVHMLNWNR